MDAEMLEASNLTHLIEEAGRVRGEQGRSVMRPVDNAL